jgi:hypothetical protein
VNRNTGQQPVEIKLGERRLFLDDADVAEIRQLRQTLHHPAKKGAVIRPDVLQYGGGIFQVRSMPFRGPEAERFRYVVVETGAPTSSSSLWESRDGLNWFPVRIGSNDTPFFSTRLPDGGSFSPYVLLRDEHDPDPARRFKSLRHAGKHLVAVTSSDLETWQENSATPVQSADEWNLSHDRDAGLYIATPKVAGVYGRSVGLATSTDFDHWTQSELMFQTDELDQELAPESIQWYMNSPTLYSQSAYPTDWDWHNVDIYNMGVFRYESIYIGIPAFFHRFGPGKPGEGPQFAFTTFPLVCSRDLHHWTRVAERQPFMRPSYMGSGAFDLAKSQPPSNAIVRDGELWFYYNGLKYSGWSPKPDFQDQDGGAVCLAVLRRDGFLSLDAGNEEGTLVTHTLSLPPRTSRLFVNLAATGGELSVALLDPAGQPLDPFRAVEVVPRPGTGTRDRPLPRFSDPIGGDHLAAEVCWKGKSDISEVAGREVRLRFRLRRTQLFSYWFA